MWSRQETCSFECWFKFDPNDLCAGGLCDVFDLEAKDAVTWVTRGQCREFYATLAPVSTMVRGGARETLELWGRCVAMCHSSDIFIFRVLIPHSWYQADTLSSVRVALCVMNPVPRQCFCLPSLLVSQQGWTTGKNPWYCTSFVSLVLSFLLATVADQQGSFHLKTNIAVICETGNVQTSFDLHSYKLCVSILCMFAPEPEKCRNSIVSSMSITALSLNLPRRIVPIQSDNKQDSASVNACAQFNPECSGNPWKCTCIRNRRQSNLCKLASFRQKAGNWKAI